MPLYEYSCVSCSHNFDIRHGADEVPELCCPECRGAVKKVFHAAGVIFKGSGWYITDNAPKNSTDKEKKVDAESAPPVTTETPATPTPA